MRRRRRKQIKESIQFCDNLFDRLTEDIDEYCDDGDSVLNDFNDVLNDMFDAYDTFEDDFNENEEYHEYGQSSFYNISSNAPIKSVKHSISKIKALEGRLEDLQKELDVVYSYLNRLTYDMHPNKDFS